jgi:CubicO group peptidase (beta-lactamase class C family)
MKSILKFFAALLFLVLLVFNGYVIGTGQFFIYKAIAYNFVDIDDYKIFDNSKILKSPAPKPWVLSKNYNKNKLTKSLVDTLVNLNSVAFLVIKNDSLINENYWEGYGKNSLSNSFSMAKSVVNMLIGIAIKEGKIKSVDQPVGDFIEAFSKAEKSKITIRHLMMMSSGLAWDESKSYKNLVAVFFSNIMEGYYGDDLYKLMMSIGVAEKPGVFFDYKSGDSQLLSIVLQKATGSTLSNYFKEKIWNNIGAENDALWCLDKPGGNEKAFCCLNTNAREFAKIGSIYLHKGFVNGIQLIDTGYVEQSLMPTNLKDKDNSDEKVDFYGWQWWLLPNYKGQNIFYMRGTLGQLVIVIPEKKIIIVRLGHAQGSSLSHHWAQTFTYIDEVNEMYPN